MKDVETKEKFMELRARGLSYDKIAKELHVSKQTLLNWSYEFRRELANCRALELDALQERYGLTGRSRLEKFGEQLGRLKSELARREFSELSTEKLCELILKFEAAIKQEDSPIQFRQKGEGHENLLESLEKMNETIWEG